MLNCKKISAFTLLVLFVMAACVTGILVPTCARAEEEKLLCHATIEDEFADNMVGVILTNSASLLDKEYTVEDFASVGCTSVRTIFGNNHEVPAERVSTYQKILYLELSEHSKQNVLDVIKVLEKRNDVYYVGPDYEYETCSTTPNDKNMMISGVWNKFMSLKLGI